MPIDFKYYLGKVDQSFLGYSLDEKIRRNAASGGMVTAILLYLLGRKQIDGALLCRQKMVKGKIDAEIFIAKKPKEILDCQGSIYFNVPILTQIKKIRAFRGRLAIVGLPCQIKTLRNLMSKDKKIKNKLILIGLFCGHASKKKLLLQVLKSKNIEENTIKKVIFRRGRWRGKMNIQLRSGKDITFPFRHFSDYQNLFFYCERQCLECGDQTNEFADISCGDIWDLNFRKKAVKHSLVLARNKKSREILIGMQRRKMILIETLTSEEVFNFQKRSLIFHKNVAVRRRIGKIFGFTTNSGEGQGARWNDLLSATLILANIKLSESRFGTKIIFAIPRRIWYIYLILFKLLTSF